MDRTRLRKGTTAETPTLCTRRGTRLRRRDAADNTTFDFADNCANCHAGDDFTADRFKNIGLYNSRDLSDAGRFEITKDSSHLGHFRIPGLRNVAVTAPYMHNGMFGSLREVLDYYNHPDKVVQGAIHRDLSLSTPLNLSEQEITDIEAFLMALTDDQFIQNKN
ncbi:MAG: c-type cytochrome [Bacteroidetes bacterium]|nr:c-type cytochrome [Bacteroidota bacterium]